MVEAGGQGAGLPAQMPELLEDYLVRIEDEVTEARVAQASLGAWISSFRLEATTVLNLARTTWGTYLAFVRGEEGPGLSEVPSFEGVFR
jgi:hypothetical protein